jgi:hypothetical protein
MIAFARSMSLTPGSWTRSSSPLAPWGLMLASLTPSSFTRRSMVSRVCAIASSRNAVCTAGFIANTHEAFGPAIRSNDADTSAAAFANAVSLSGSTPDTVKRVESSGDM